MQPATSRPEIAPPATLGFILALLSGVLLAAELTLTRLLSVVLWYHFAFFAISVALFGLSMAALLVHFVGARIAPERVGFWLALGALGVAVGLIAVDLAFCNVAPDWFAGGLGVFTALTGKLLLLFLLSAVPFFAGGFSVSLALTSYAGHASRLYFWDLLGAALGALATIALLNAVGAPRALALLAAVAGVSAMGFVGLRRSTAPRWTAPLAGVLAIACACFGVFGGRALTIHVAKGISLDQSEPEFMQWNAFSLVSVLPNSGFKGWGLAPTFKGQIADQKTLVIDMNAMTPLVNFDGDFGRAAFVSNDLSAFVYRVKPDASAACVIGAGGGKDVIASLASGTQHVTAVEVNPIIVNQVMRGRYRDYVGDLYGRPDVSAVVEDGRSFVRRTENKFDIVHLSMVDTSAASAAGAYALTENALYTQEAFVDFMHALKPGGVLSVSSVSLPDLWVGARLASIARAALNSQAWEVDVEHSVLMLETPWLGVREARMYTLLIAPHGFGQATVDRAIAQAGELGFSMAWVPGHKVVAGTPERALIQKILTEKDDRKLNQDLSALPLDVSATTDDRPFFFYQNRMAQLPLALIANTPLHLFGNGLVLLAKIAAIALLCVGALLLLPLIFGGRDRSRDQGRTAADLGYSACIGFGFLFVELGLLHRLSPHLGDPTAALGVVLVALLIGSALGSKFLAARNSVLVRALIGALVLVILLAAALLPVLADATRAWQPASRAGAVGALVLMVGVLLGVPLPAALAHIFRRAPGRVAWFWALNGGMSVLASVVGTLIALNYGSTVTLLSGATAYVGCLLLSGAVLREPAAQRDAAEPELAG